MRRKAAARPAPAIPDRVEFEIRVDRTAKGRRRVRPVPTPTHEPTPGPQAAVPEVPKITQLLVVAYWWERLIAEGKVRDYAEIARLTGLSRARVTQMVQGTLLSPAAQSEILSQQERIT